MRSIKSMVLLIGFLGFSSVFAGGSSSGNLREFAGGSSAGNLTAWSSIQRGDLVMATAEEALAQLPEGTRAVKFEAAPFGQSILWATDGEWVVRAAVLHSSAALPTEPGAWRTLREKGQAQRALAQ